MLTFEWYGQACFRIENSTTVVTDPHDGEAVGLNPPPSEAADLVTISHDHYDHASGEGLVSKKSSVTVRDPEERTEKGVKVKGIHSFHDQAEGGKRGENVIFLLEWAGLRVCHLGDLGHQLEDQYLEQIGSIDVLLVPVGGNYTIDGSEAAALTEKMGPQIVVPMHFHVEGLTVEVSGPEEFLENMPRSYEVKETDRLKPKPPTERKQIVRLDCLGN